MKLVTVRVLIQRVTESWERAYCTEGEWCNDRVKSMYEALLKLDTDKATPQDVDAIIGSDSWTSLSCDECRKEVAIGIEFKDGDGETRVLCETCLKDSLNLIKVFKKEHRLAGVPRYCPHGCDKIDSTTGKRVW